MAPKHEKPPGAGGNARYKKWVDPPFQNLFWVSQPNPIKWGKNQPFFFIYFLSVLIQNHEKTNWGFLKFLGAPWGKLLGAGGVPPEIWAK